MIMRFIPNVNPGDSVGSKPTFPVNAQVRGDFLYLRDANGNQIAGRSVSDGDEITVLKVDHGKQLALVQYPAGTVYRQGYVTNATNIIKYKNEYNWSNGSTSEVVYDVDKTTQIGSLNPGEKATILYKVDGMTALVYDTSKGKMTKSGLVHYEGTGGSTGGGDINGIAPGGEVPGGFTYPNNAQVIGDDLYLRDANGNQIAGRLVSNGDNITVLDVGYTKQLALVQYPAGSIVRQGYVTNATNIIRYFRQGEWLNGSTTEIVLDENGGQLGSLSPYEAATPLYEKNGMTHVVYDTSKGPNTKSGYVRYEGLSELPDTGIQIPSTSHSQATVEVYGTSGKGRPLKVYKIGTGSKVLFAGFALHGWEDNWDNDGLALVKIANSLIEKVGDYKAQNGLHGWTVYIAPCMNPDGVIVRGTNNGPGRCAVKSRVDMNRCFPRGFAAKYDARQYTGPNPLGAQEAVALKNFIEKINRTADELVVIDAHGWLGCTYGNSSIAEYFTNQFGFSHKGESFGGYFSYWAQGLPRTKAILLEYPRSTYSYNDVINGNYIGKTFNGIINVLKNNPNGDGGGNPGGDGGGNPSGDIVVGSKVKIIGTHWATGQLIPDWAKNTTHTVGRIDGNRALLQEVTSWIYLKDIVLADGGGNPSGDVAYSATGTVVNVSTVLNVRSKPSTSGDIVATINGGQTVKIIAKNGEWYKINSPANGYVHSDYIRINDDSSNGNDGDIAYSATGTVTMVSSVNNKPSSNGDLVGTVNRGQTVKIIAKNGEWYKISSPANGYVHSDYIKINSESTDGVSPGGEEEWSLFSAGIAINSTKYNKIEILDKPLGSPIGTLEIGEKVQVTALKNGWYKIEEPKIGYVSTRHIKLDDYGINPMHQQVRNIYVIIDKDTLGHNAVKFSQESKETSIFNQLFFVDLPTAATFFGVIPGIPVKAAAAAGYIGAAMTALSIIANNGKACYSRLADIYAEQFLKYGEGPADENTKYNVIKIPIVFIDPHYDKYNPKPTTKGEWVLSYSNAEFIYGTASLEQCMKFVDSQPNIIWNI